MRKLNIQFKGENAGILIQNDNGTFIFQYNDKWLTDSSKPSISLTLPKDKRVFHSKYLFPFFFNLLPEASNKKAICSFYKIDSDDYFSLFMVTTKYDSVGAITTSSSTENL